MSAHLDNIFESPLGGLSHEGDISIHDLTKRHRGVGVKAPRRRYESGLGSSRATERLVASTNQSFVMALSRVSFGYSTPQ